MTVNSIIINVINGISISISIIIIYCIFYVYELVICIIFITFYWTAAG